MDVRQILTEYLKANGYDGLYHDECGCSISDLAPCDMPLNCKPGHKSKQLHTYEAETDNAKGGAPMD